MDPMSPTILDMAQVFGLRPSSRCVDITHDWSSPSRLTGESSGAFESITRLEYTLFTFKSYGTSFAGFIPFAKKTFNPPSSTADRAQEHMRYPWFSNQIFHDAFGEDTSSTYKEKFISCIQQRDLAWRVRIDRVGYERRLEVYHPNFCGSSVQPGSKELLHPQACGSKFRMHPSICHLVKGQVIEKKAAAEVAMQEARSSQSARDTGDISELFGDSEVEARPEVKTRAPCRARATMSGMDVQQADKEILDTILEDLKI
ncbi:hypothetical protein TB1_000436 [Malus domestica]